ncbi:PIN-like domain-containing protein [Aquirufa antheringensis]
MKKKFIGFYNPTEFEIKEAWENGRFAFDANTLLNLYRYTEPTRNDFLTALNTIQGNLFLPYQAALEFHSNRINVIDSIIIAYSEVNNLFYENFEKTLKPLINQYQRHPSILIEEIQKIYLEILEKISKELTKQEKAHPDFVTKDDVLEKLSTLFENSTGIEFSKDDLNNIYKEGEKRYSGKIPPGFKDLEKKKNKGDKHIYGDLIIWKELIEYTKKEKKPLIFVTDDRKEDWWTIESGKTIRPREELIKEFFDLTGIRILIYNADNFLHFAKEKGIIPNLKEKTLSEIKDVRISDEKEYSLSDFQKISLFNTDTFNFSDLVYNKSIPSDSSFYLPKYDSFINSDLTKNLGQIFTQEPFVLAKNLKKEITKEDLILKKKK